MIQNIQIQKDVPLGQFTTLNIGGPARFFIRAESELNVIAAFKFAEENGFELFVLGGGSNVVISDQGFDGVVIQIAIKGSSIRKADENTAFITAGAGEEWDEIVKLSVDKGLQGLECLSGIPGSVGGTPVQNVGAYGQDVAESIHLVRCFDRKTQSIIELSNNDCKFSYRTSIFNSTEKERFIVLSVKYKMTIDGKPKIVYADLQKHFEGKTPTLMETRKAVLGVRGSKSMVIREGDPNSKSVGSFFKNPIVSNDDYEMIQEMAQDSGLIDSGQLVPRFKVDAENVKIPAAWLIENAGFHKGYRNGKAGISSKHSLAIINPGNASASDVLKLKKEIQAAVNEKFNILLLPEPVFVGF